MVAALAPSGLMTVQVNEEAFQLPDCQRSAVGSNNQLACPNETDVKSPLADHSAEISFPLKRKERRYRELPTLHK
jgi:hypothetical protein